MVSRLVLDGLGRGSDLEFYCPGCKSMHRVPISGDRQPGRPVWQWNGSLEKPTISPSILRRTGPFPDGHTDVCHSFVRDGKIEFCGDCTHALSGQTIDIPHRDEITTENSEDRNAI